MADIDARYSQNVIFSKDGLDELLTNIKNYPIIDIEEVVEGETDELHTDFDVWQAYTGGSPCIKITYGDTSNASANRTVKPEWRARKSLLVRRSAAITKCEDIYKQYEIYKEDYWDLIKNLYLEIITSIKKAKSNLDTRYTDLMEYISKTDSNCQAEAKKSGVFATHYIIISNLTDRTLIDNNSYANLTKNAKYYTNTTTQPSDSNYYKLTLLANSTALETQLKSLTKSDDARAQAVYEAGQNALALLNGYNKDFETREAAIKGTEVINLLNTYYSALVGLKEEKFAKMQAVFDEYGLTEKEILGKARTLQDTSYGPNDADVKAAKNNIKTEQNQVEYETIPDDKKIKGYKYVKVGSNITFGDGKDDDQATGTIRVTINGKTQDVVVKGLGGTGGAVTLGGDTAIGGNLTVTGTGNFSGKVTAKDFIIKDSNPEISLTGVSAALSDFKTAVGTSLATKSTSAKFWRGDQTWSNELTDRFHVKLASTNNTKPTAANSTGVGISTNGHIYCDKYIVATKVYNAVFNDYAEFRTTNDEALPGRCVYDLDDGSIEVTNRRLIPGVSIVSDTYGHCMGETDTCKTPLAVAGRVLAYPFGDRENYHAGMAVCCGPNGTIDIMTRKEIINYPDCIVGYVSEIPQYDTWGTDNVKVDGRIWIKIK